MLLDIEDLEGFATGAPDQLISVMNRARSLP
jgi:hypothetical protein